MLRKACRFIARYERLWDNSTKTILLGLRLMTWNSDTCQQARTSYNPSYAIRSSFSFLIHSLTHYCYSFGSQIFGHRLNNVQLYIYIDSQVESKRREQLLMQCGSRMQPLIENPAANHLHITSSNLRLCSFCSSILFCRSANSCLLCSSFSRCCCSSCCRRRASDRSLFASWSLKKSRLSVDSPGKFRMELQGKQNSYESRDLHRITSNIQRGVNRKPPICSCNNISH